MHTTHLTAVLVAHAAFFLRQSKALHRMQGHASNRFDADQSSTGTWAEAYKAQTQQFMAMDTNMDGIIT